MKPSLCVVVCVVCDITGTRGAVLVTELALLTLLKLQPGICPVNSSGCPTVNIANDLIL